MALDGVTPMPACRRGFPRRLASCRHTHHLPTCPERHYTTQSERRSRSCAGCWLHLSACAGLYAGRALRGSLPLGSQRPARPSRWASECTCPQTTTRSGCGLPSYQKHKASNGAPCGGRSEGQDGEGHGSRQATRFTLRDKQCDQAHLNDRSNQRPCRPYRPNKPKHERAKKSHTTTSPRGSS